MTRVLMLAIIALIVPFGLIALSWLALPLTLFYFGRQLLRTVGAHSLSQSDVTAIADRLYRLEERVEQIATDTERIAEGQHFATALFAAHSTRTPR